MEIDERAGSRSQGIFAEDKPSVSVSKETLRPRRQAEAFDFLLLEHSTEDVTKRGVPVHEQESSAIEQRMDGIRQIFGNLFRPGIHATQPGGG